MDKDAVACHFLSEVIAESMWRAMGWILDESPNTVINSLKKVFRWRSTKWSPSSSNENRTCNFFVTFFFPQSNFFQILFFYFSLNFFRILSLFDRPFFYFVTFLKKKISFCVS